MLIDQKRKTIYSSYTGETVNVGDTLDDNETAVIKPAGVTKIIDEYEHKISYKTLASLVGKEQQRTILLMLWRVFFWLTMEWR